MAIPTQSFVMSLEMKWFTISIRTNITRQSVIVGDKSRICLKNPT